MNGVRRYRNGQSSVAGVGVGIRGSGHGADRVAGWLAAGQRRDGGPVGQGAPSRAE